MPDPELDRAAIRRATADALVGATAAGTRVHRTRRLPSKRTGLPALMVYALEDRMGRLGDSGAPTFEHDLTLVVEAAVDGAGAEDEALDALCAQVLDRLLKDPAWLEVAGEVRAVRTRIAMSGEGDDDYLGAAIQFDLRFRTEWEPRVPDALTHVRVGVDLIDPPGGGPDGVPEAELRLDPPQ